VVIKDDHLAHGMETEIRGRLDRLRETKDHTDNSREESKSNTSEKGWVNKCREGRRL